MEASNKKNTCLKHRKDVCEISDMKVLAEMIGDLHYETLDVFLDNLAVKLHRDGIKDFNAGRKELGNALQNTGLYIQKSRLYMGKAWQISKPFMNQKL